MKDTLISLKNTFPFSFPYTTHTISSTLLYVKPLLCGYTRTIYEDVEVQTQKARIPAQVVKFPEKTREYGQSVETRTVFTFQRHALVFDDSREWETFTPRIGDVILYLEPLDYTERRYCVADYQADGKRFYILGKEI